MDKIMTDAEMNAEIAKWMGYKFKIPDNQCCGIGNEQGAYYKDGEFLMWRDDFTPCTDLVLAMEFAVAMKFAVDIDPRFLEEAGILMHIRGSSSRENNQKYCQSLADLPRSIVKTILEVNGKE